MKDKKQEQLGMNPSTASGRLVKDILYKLVVQTGQNSCYHCGNPMDRSTFSIEHKTPWLDSDAPLFNYFNLDNISFSHLRCNISVANKDAQTSKRLGCGSLAAYSRGCRCTTCKEAASVGYKRRYSPEKRRARYIEKGH